MDLLWRKSAWSQDFHQRKSEAQDQGRGSWDDSEQETGNNLIAGEKS